MIENINTGLVENDGLGAKLRDAFNTVNSNFIEVSNLIENHTNTISNIEGLQTELDNITTSISILEYNVSNIDFSSDIISIQDDINAINTSLTTINNSLNSLILGYIPENEDNKQDSLDVDGTGTKYPTVDAVNSGFDSLALVATSNDYNDLDNLPNISINITNTSDLINDGADGVSTYIELNEVSTVAISGKHSDLILDDGTNPHNTTAVDVGLGNVDNTSDLNKPISTATQTTLDLKVDKATSSTDEAIARFDGTTGKFIQNSSVRITDNGSIVLPENSAPTTPSAGEMKFFSRQIANRLLPAFISPSGLDSTLQPFLARNKVGYWNPSGNSTTVPGLFGFNAPLTIGFTATTRNVVTTNLFTRMRRFGYATVATAGAVGQWRVSGGQFTVGSSATNLGGFTYIIRFGISDPALVAGARMFMGIQANSNPTNVEPSTIINCIGIGHGASNTNLRLFYGGSVAQTPIDLGVNFPSNTRSTDVYELALFSPPNSGDVSWEVTRLNTGDVASGTIVNSGVTVLPTNTTLLAPWGYRTNNTTALAVGIDIMSAYIETDY